VIYFPPGKNKKRLGGRPRERRQKLCAQLEKGNGNILGHPYERGGAQLTYKPYVQTKMPSLAHDNRGSSM